jgi:hypothetical protein
MFRARSSLNIGVPQSPRPGNRRITPQGLQCPLWVKSGHPTTPRRTSAIGGKADIGKGLMWNRDPNVRFWG